MMSQAKRSHLNTGNRDTLLNIFGTYPTAEKQPYAAIRADYGVNARIVKTTVANGGTVTSDQSRLKLSTGTASDGSAKFVSAKRLRYLNSFGGQVDFTAVFSPPSADSTQLIGLGDAEDGFFVGYDGLDFGVMRRRAGVDNWVYQNSWNGDVADGAIAQWNKETGNVLRIDFQYLGYGFIVFMIEDFEAMRASEVTLYRILHVMEYPNTSPLTHILNPTLPLYAEVTNDGNESDVVLFTPSMVASLQGGPVQPNPLDLYNSADAFATFGDTNNNHLMSVRNNTTINSIANRVPMELARVTFTRASAGSTLTRFRLYRNGATAGALTYTDVSATDSPGAFSVTATTVTTTQAEEAYILNPDGGVLTIDFRPGEFVLQPGEWVTVGAQNSGVQSTDVGVTLTWVEQF